MNLTSDFVAGAIAGFLFGFLLTFACWISAREFQIKKGERR